jgi:integrase
VWYCRQSKKAGKLNPVKIIGPAAPVIENRKLQYGDGYLFPGKTPGTHRTTYRRRFNRAKKYLGLNFAFKDFRHTYATLLIESNVPITDVKKMLGHSRLSTTERYIKTSDEAVNRALDQLERRIQDEGYLDTD